MNKWLNKAVFYEIYPQSFKDTNADGIGDINGITEKLDYIRELGCNAIWMNPCFQSPFGDAGYDVSDYYTVAERYGTNEDIKHLFEEVHKRDMHILLDLVPGHTSIEHKWFKESMKAEKNAYSDRYIWTDSIWEMADTTNTTHPMSSLRGISDRDGSCAVNFFSHQPALNYGFYEIEKPWQQPMDAPAPKATLEEMKNIMRFWLKMGCDGFRVDMAASLVKNDYEAKGTIKLWQNVRGFLDREFPNAVLVSEWGEPDKALAGGFHMDFLLHYGPSHYNDLFRCEQPYFSSNGKGDASKFVKYYTEIDKMVNGKGLICIPSGNHDMERLSYFVHGDELKIAFAFILSMPGAPFIYYGDEIGMRYLKGITSVEGGYDRTGARTPMQWNEDINAGFSNAAKDKLYIQQDESTDRPTVQGQIADSNSLYNAVKKLIEIRQNHSALQNGGSIEFVFAKEKTYPLAYIRTNKNEKVLVIINPSAKEVSFTGSYYLDNAIYNFGETAICENGEIHVKPCSAGFYRI